MSINSKLRSAGFVRCFDEHVLRVLRGKDDRYVWEHPGLSGLYVLSLGEYWVTVQFDDMEIVDSDGYSSVDALLEGLGLQGGKIIMSSGDNLLVEVNDAKWVIRGEMETWATADYPSAVGYFLSGVDDSWIINGAVRFEGTERSMKIVSGMLDGTEYEIRNVTGSGATYGCCIFKNGELLFYLAPEDWIVEYRISVNLRVDVIREEVLFGDKIVWGDGL